MIAIYTEHTAQAGKRAWNTRPAPALAPKQAAADEMFDALKLWHAYERGSLKNSMAQMKGVIQAALAKAGQQ